MKKRPRKRRERWELPTTEQLLDIWEEILSNTDTREALERLGEAGFRISYLKPEDATFGHPTWADYIAAIPLVPNEPSTRQIHHKIRFRKYWPLVQELRQFASKVNVPFVALAIYGTKDYPVPGAKAQPVSGMADLREDLLKAASILEAYLSWDCSLVYLNPRNALIAELRWTIRDRTGRPHDRELNVLIDAAFRACGCNDGYYIDSTALDRIEKRQKESRVKAHRRILSLIRTSSPSPRSTRIRRISRKRV